MSDPEVGPDSFGADVHRALTVWRSQPRLPFTHLAFVVAGLLERAAWLRFLALPVGVAGLGWIGTTHIWYLRGFRGLPLEWREVRRFTLRFIPRAFCAVILAAIPAAVAAVPLLILFRHRYAWAVGSLVAGGILYASLLTFVWPALAFTTRRARSALKVGISELGRTWPECAPYVIVPTLVGGAGAAAAYLLRDSPLNFMTAPIGSLIGLALQGAVAAFYLRRYPTGASGALEAPPPRPDSQLG